MAYKVLRLAASKQLLFVDSPRPIYAGATTMDTLNDKVLGRSKSAARPGAPAPGAEPTIGWPPLV